MSRFGVKHTDLVAAKKLIDLHATKLDRALVIEDYPSACSALRALQEECNNASKVATSLSLNSHLNNTERR